MDVQLQRELQRAFLTFGNEATIKGKSQTTYPTSACVPAYNVKLLGISIGTKQLSIDPAQFKLRSGPSGGFFTDSGSPYTVFTISAYSILRQEMVQYVMQ
ncbi:hypothetical protein M0R45_028227 [Rubus argutus]|uniref:Xylanase inhibitor C-terminal domain-containing protein n=1 Tax=Rubus argutus TaxID=59490 RepID=A0AAW1W6N0_RUBAR